MNPFVAIGWPLVFILGIVALGHTVSERASEGSPDECRQSVVARFDRGEIPSLERLDAELLACAQ